MKKDLSKLEIDCESIRKDIKECGRLYITVAYKVYELYIYEVYKEKYKNIVECCREEFGFKKSTTYRFLGIVSKFGEKEHGVVTYRSLMRYDKFTYSQLSEMLSLSDGQRKKITSDMSVSKIRSLKKVPTSGKIEEVKVPESELEVIEVLPEQLQVEKVQMSGKKVENDLIEQLKKENELLYKESESKLKSLLERCDAFRERLLKDEEIIKSQSETISEYMKKNEKLICCNSILEADCDMLRTKIYHLEDEIKKLKSK